MTGGRSHAAPRLVAVLGAGTMGAQIAAHFANAAIPVLLLDQTAALAREGLERARSLKPSPFFSPDLTSLITIGGIDADLDRLADADWIVEAVVEQPDIKRELLARVDAVRHADAIVSSNTSALSVTALAEGRSEGFQRHWLGTHFFNPPRYLHLVELIPTAATAPEVVGHLEGLLDRRLGKGPIVAKDTPGFIANHLGLLSMAQALEAVASGRYTIEEVDAITGTPLGRPKSATFRTMDIAGLDIVLHVMRDLHSRLPEHVRDRFRPPALLEALVERRWLGEKTGQGFYRREAGRDGRSVILALDTTTMEYRPVEPVRIPSLQAARAADAAGRIRALFGAADNAGTFLRETLPPWLLYVARVTPEIAHSIDDVDRAMRWGFGWETGPFELLDALGARTVVEAYGSAAPDEDVPPLVTRLLNAGRQRLRDTPLPPAAPDLQLLRSARDAGRVIKSNSAGSLVNLGDGVLAVELHSKMNVIGGETLAMLDAGISEAEQRFAALVVGTEAVNFSAGADLMLLLLEAREGNWDEIDLMVRRFQHVTSRLRSASIPVVVATAGLTLGGGCEIALHGHQVQAAAESYIGLVETGVGLIPAAGGTKEMLARASERAAPGADLLPLVRTVFETIGLARTSGSARGAQALGYLDEADGITMNRERLMEDAKQRALGLVREGRGAPPPRTAVRVGGADLLATLKLGLHLAWRAGRLSDHDVVVGRKLAWVLAGGDLPHAGTVSEAYLLELERQAFLGLCGEPKTLDRLQHTLSTGKPLRN